MNSFQSEKESIQATYMSQSEANEVMELWQRRQENSERNSLITIHDVAEATQLSTQDVEKLLQEVRSFQSATQRGTNRAPETAQQRRDPTLWEAYVRLAPLTGIVAVAMAVFLEKKLNSGRMVYDAQNFVDFLIFYAVITFGGLVTTWAKAWIAQAARKQRPNVDRYSR